MSDENQENMPALGQGTEGVQGQITFPFQTTEAFADFISSLLGQSQKMRQRRAGVFDVDHEWARDTHYLLMQRTTQQNNGKLLEFSAEIFFENGMSHVLTSFDAFSNFKEVKPLVSRALLMKWSFLIDFPNKNTPEKQEIEIYVSDGSDFNWVNSADFEIKIPSDRIGVIFFEISSTERTWAEDIENILKNHFDRTFKDSGVKRKFLRKYLSVLVPSIVLSGFGVPNFVKEKIEENTHLEKVEILNNINSNKFGIDAISDKIDLIINSSFSAYHGLLNDFFVPFIFLLSIICCFLLVAISTKIDPSFVVLTKRAKERRDKKITSNRAGVFVLIASFIVSIVSGVVANILFYFYVN